MKTLSKVLLAALILPSFAFALDANIFEKEKDTKLTSFSAKVRVVRDVDTDVEVFFDSDKAKGGYTLPRTLHNYAAALAALEASKKSGAPVTVIADSEKRIAEVKEGPAAPKNEDILKQYDAIFKH